MEKSINRLVVIGTLAAAVSAALPAMAMSSPDKVQNQKDIFLTEKVAVKSEGEISPMESRIIQNSAARVLRQIIDARASIKKKDYDWAKSQLNDVVRSIGYMKSELPTARVRDHIWSAQGDIDLDSTEEVLEDLIPIYQGLTMVEGFVPVGKAKAHLDQAKKHLEKGHKVEAKQELEAADAAIIYTEFDLPLASTEKQVKAALDALAKKQPKKAAEALKKAENGVQVISSVDVLVAPIVNARNSLWQASQDYMAKDYTAAKADLDSAGNWLDNVARNADKTTQKEAVKLKQKVDALKDEVGEGGEKTAAKLKDLSDRGEALATHHVTKQTAIGWGKRPNSIGAMTANSLLNARLFLANAESAQFNIGGISEALDQLELADDELKYAAKHANKKLVPNVNELRDVIKSLKTTLRDNSGAVRAQYEAAISDLKKLMENPLS